MARKDEEKFSLGHLLLTLTAILGLMWVYGENAREEREDARKKKVLENTLADFAEVDEERRSESAEAAAVEFMDSIGVPRHQLISVTQVSGDGLFYEFQLKYVRSMYLIEVTRQCDSAAFEALKMPACWKFQLFEYKEDWLK